MNIGNCPRNSGLVMAFVIAPVTVPVAVAAAAMHCVPMLPGSKSRCHLPLQLVAQLSKPHSLASNTPVAGLNAIQMVPIICGTVTKDNPDGENAPLPFPGKTVEGRRESIGSALDFMMDCMKRDPKQRPTPKQVGPIGWAKRQRPCCATAMLLGGEVRCSIAGAGGLESPKGS